MQIKSGDVALLRKRIFIAVIFVALFLTFMMFLPFLTAGILGILFAIILAPFSDFVCKKTNWSQQVVATVIVLIITVGIIVPVGFASWKLISASSSAVQMVADSDNRLKLQKHLSAKVLQLSDRYPGQKKWFEKAVNVIDNSQVMLLGGAGLSKFVPSTGGKIAKAAKNTFVAGLFIIAQFIVVMKIMHYILSNKKTCTESVVMMMPIERKKRDSILLKLKNAVKDIAYGMFLNGVVQGGVGIFVVVFYLLIFNPVNPWYYVIIVAVLFIGSVFTLPVSGIAVAICAFTEFAQGNTSIAIALLFCMWLVGISDNIPKKIVGDRIGFGFVTTILATACGVGLFGVIGVMLGVLLLITTREIYTFNHTYLRKYDEESVTS